MRTRRLTLLSSSIALLLAGLAGPVAAARPAPAVTPSTPSNGAWVVVRSPGRATSTPGAGDQGNTTHGTNTVKRTAVGRWQVRFPGIRAYAVAQVVALNTAPRRCQITNTVWNPGGVYTAVSVACFTPAGAPVDTRFIATITRGGTSGDAARFLGLAAADDPTAGAAYTPIVRRNSMGGSVHVTRNGVGHYAVSFETPLDSAQSIAVVTAVAAPTQQRACQVIGWGASSGQANIDVACQDGTGVAADSRFTLQYGVRTGLEGILNGPAASFWNDTPTSGTPWAPLGYYDYSTANKLAKIAQVSTGVYRVTLKGMPAGGAAIVNAYDQGRTCQVGSIRSSGTPQQVEVRCFLFDGTPADVDFDFAYTH
ncbi:MAG: hypothetical protein U0869_02290 [Chloroflexota bacterium]